MRQSEIIRCFIKLCKPKSASAQIVSHFNLYYNVCLKRQKHWGKKKGGNPVVLENYTDRKIYL